MKKQYRALAFFFCVLTGGRMLAAPAPDDWPQWRGPNRDGVSAEQGLLKEWPASGPPLVWTATGLGKSYSGIAIAGDTIFTQGDKGGKNYVIALHRQTGKPLWEAELGKAGAPGWGNFEGSRCVPSVDANLVIAVAQYGEVACLDAGTGQVKWLKDYKDFGGQLPEWGFSGMPLIDGENVILAPGGSRGDLIALKKATGETVWQSKELTDSIHYSSPIVAVIGGVRQYIQLTETSVAGVAANDGRVLWRARRKGQTAVIPTPIFYDGYVYVTSGYGVGCSAFRITAADGKFSAAEVYSNKVMANHHGGVIRQGEYVYGYSDAKGWTCQELKSGKAVWQEKTKLGKGAIAYADGRFYLRAEDGKGTVALVDATPEGYRERGRFNPPHRSDKNAWVHPVIAGGKLYLRDQDVLLCYDVKAK
ncbi:MAG: PQQ-binding-like beta-propeller repeat protein [Verrucomicrobiota bacterium]